MRGFHLAGVPGQAVSSAQEAVSAMKAVMSRTEFAVIILTEKVAGDMRAEVEQIRYEQDRPLIVEIPGPAGSSPGRKSLRQLAQEAVGIHIEPEKGN